MVKCSCAGIVLIVLLHRKLVSDSDLERKIIIILTSHHMTINSPLKKKTAVP